MNTAWLNQLVVALALLSVCAAALAAESPVRIDFDIPQQSVRTALMEFAEQADLTLVFPDDAVRDRTANPLFGRYTLQEGADILLAGTGLVPMFSNRVVLSISAGEPMTKKGNTLKASRRMPILSRLATAIVTGLFATSAAAAETTDDFRADSTIEEIVVRALKRGDQSLAETAAGISVIDGDVIDAANYGSVQDFLQTVPSVSVDAAIPGQTGINIRGVNTTFGPSSVGYYADDLPFSFVRLNILPDLQPFDLESIEILRGPQGTLYGAGSAGGVVILNTADPDLRKFGARIQGTAGSIDDGGDVYSVSGVLNVPVVEDQFALRLIASHRDNGGWIDGSVNGSEGLNDSDNSIFRIKALWLATDELEVEAMANVSRMDSGASNLEDESGEYPDIVDLPGFADYDQYGLVVTYDTDWFTLRNATSYVDYSSLWSIGFNEIVFLPVVSDVESVVNETRLVSNGDGRFSWVAGYFYRDSEELIRQDLTNFGIGMLIEHGASKQNMIYGEGTLAFDDGFYELTAGLSYFRDQVNASGSAGFSTGKSEQMEPDILSPKLSIAIHPTESSTAYATYSRGFRSAIHDFRLSTFSANAAGLLVDGEVDEEIHTALEIGYRASLWNYRAFIDIALFRTELEDIQQSVGVPVPGSSISVTAVLNAGEAESRGIEWSLSVDLTDSLQFQTAGSYVEAELSEDFFGPGATTPSFREGDSLNLVPDLTASATVNYSFAMGMGMSGLLTGGVQYSDGRRLVQHSQPAREGDAVTRVDLRAEITKGDWSVFAFVNNALDEDGLVTPNTIQGTFESFGQPFDTAIGGRWQPRTIGIGFRGSLAR